MSPELIVALFFGFVATALALAALFHSHWVHLRTFSFLRRSHGEVMAAKSGENDSLSGGGPNGLATGTDISKQAFIAQALDDHKRIYNYIKGQRTLPTNATRV